jgi:5-methylcytosine-specific restriction endonuclease McrA
VKHCYFCGEAITGPCERHHITPKRYVRNSHQANIAPAHPECHRKAHHLYDDPRWKLWEFRKEMEPLNYLQGIFA